MSISTSLQRAERINEEHRAGNAAALNALEHYYRAGVLLNEQKAELPHGAWLPWLETNFEGDPRTAQRYMRLADNWHAIQANTTEVSYLTLTQALGVLTEPREPKGFHALRQLMPSIEFAEVLAALRDHKACRDNYSVFEEYCGERYGLDPDGLKAILELLDPDSIPLRDAAIVVMCKRNLTFKDAIDYALDKLQEHLASAA